MVCKENMTYSVFTRGSALDGKTLLFEFCKLFSKTDQSLIKELGGKMLGRII